MSSNPEKIGLALSGGGVRASAYHAGVLLYLAEQNLLDKITHISSVSGGTLFTGLVFHFSNFVWPSSKYYQEETFLKIRNTLTTLSLQNNAALRCLCPFNWKFFFTRANILAQSIENLWGITGTLGELPAKPSWSINGTTSETGRRFRFKDCRLGDYELGYADATNFNLASAMAISAAFPVGIGPLSINSKQYSWHKREAWDADEECICDSPYDTLHIYDGGLYDNLGIEPMFDMGKQALKESSNADCLILSDAGAPYERIKIPSPLDPRRIARLVDLLSDQTRALRIRSFVNYLQKNPKDGLYCRLGEDPLTLPKNHADINDECVKKFYQEKWMDSKNIEYALHYKTTLQKMKPEDFDIIARHGYESAKSVSMLFWYT